MKTVSNRLIASCFAMSSFAVAIVSGLASDNPTAEVLWRAVVAMAVCYPLGLIVGMVCERVISAHLEAHELANPAPDSVNLVAAANAEAGDEEALIV